MRYFLISILTLLMISSFACKQNADQKIKENDKKVSEAKLVSNEIIQNTDQDWKTISRFLIDNSPFRECGDGIFIYFEK